MCERVSSSLSICVCLSITHRFWRLLTITIDLGTNLLFVCGTLSFNLGMIFFIENSNCQLLVVASYSAGEYLWPVYENCVYIYSFHCA